MNKIKAHRGLSYVTHLKNQVSVPAASRSFSQRGIRAENPHAEQLRLCLLATAQHA